MHLGSANAAVSVPIEADFGGGNHLCDAEQAVHLSPELGIAYFVRGSAEKNLGQYDRAIADCQQAVKLKPALKAAGEALREVKPKL